jgi:lysophospholipase L1-like esterase
MKIFFRKNILTLGLLVMLAASVYLNVHFYQLGKYFYIREARVRLNPVGVPDQPGPLATAEGVTVVVTGDSRARHWSMESCDGIRFLNHGVGNETTAQILLRLDGALGEGSADAYLIEAGINDLKVIPLMPEKKEKITRDCIANLREIATQLATSGKPVIIATIFPCGEVPLARRMWWSPDVEAAVTAVNRAILNMDGEQGIRVFDAHKVLAEADGKARLEYQMDQLHMNAQAYRALNKELMPLLPRP